MNEKLIPNIRFVLIFILVFCVSSMGIAEEIILENNSGVKMLIPQKDAGYVFGSFTVNTNGRMIFSHNGDFTVENIVEIKKINLNQE